MFRTYAVDTPSITGTLEIIEQIPDLTTGCLQAILDHVTEELARRERS